MSTPNDTRLVPMSKAQRDALRGGPSAWLPVQEITAAWDAAPADPAEAVAAWFNAHFPGALDNQDLAEFAADVLHALGVKA